MMFKTAFSLLIVVLFYSCQSQDIKFSHAEHLFLNSFTAGDSLFFKNQEGKIDTIVISGIQSRQYVEGGFRHKRFYKSISVLAKIIPRDSLYLKYLKQKDQSPVRNAFKNIFTLKKQRGDKEASFYYNFKNMIGGKSYLFTLPDTVRLNDSLFNNCYRIYTGREGVFINEMYLSLQNGLIGYSYGGKTWVKIDHN